MVAKGTGGVDVSSAVAVPEEDALDRFFLACPDIVFSILTIWYKKNMKLRMQNYKS